MKKQFVTYEIALKLKELGFNEPCFSAYTESGNLMDIGDYSNDDKIGELEGHSHYISCTAPLYQQVTDWFREKHNIHIEIELTDNTMQFYYQYCIVDSKNREHHDEDMIDQATRIYNYNERFNTYEEAREQAILKVIELCQKEK